MAKSAWARYATHMSMVGGLFLGPIGEESAWTQMFKKLVPEEEAELACKISNKPSSVEQIAKTAGMSVEEATPMLVHLAQKGLLFERVTKNGEHFYNVPPFIPGFYEYVMTDPDTIKNPEIAALFRKAIDDLAGGIMVTCPSETDLRDPELGPYVEKYLKGVDSVPTINRLKIMRLIENLTLGTAAVGYRTESLHGAGSPQAQRIIISRQSDMAGKKDMAKDIVGIE